MSVVRPRNNITFVMMAASAVVLVRHSAILLGPEAATGRLWGMPPLGIFILLAISGYLLVPSWQRRPHLGRYLVDRVARLFPALAVTVLVSVLLLGALVTTFPLQEYFRDPLTGRYFLNLLLNPQYALPGVFVDNPVSRAVNGTLWSLPAQFLAYLLIPLWALVPGRRTRGVGWLVLAAACAWGSAVPESAEVVVWGSQLAQVLVVLPCFFVGAAVRELMGTPKAWMGVAAAVAAIVLTWAWPESAPIVNWSLTPFAAVAIGASSTPVLRDFGRFGNPSFGIFLVGFPVQQALIAGFGVAHAWISMLATVVISVVLGYVSERCVELPVLAVVHRWTRRSRAPEVVAVSTGAAVADAGAAVAVPGEQAAAPAARAADAADQATTPSGLVSARD